MLTFTIIQTHLHWQDKSANLQHLEEKINSITTPTHVIVLPEMFSTAFSMQAAALAETMDGPTVQWMKNLATQKKVILSGSIIIEEDGKYYNRLIWMQPNGIAFHYDKRHCFSLAKEDEHFTAGTEKIIVQANGVKICLQICYDLRFPVFSRQTKENPYDVLLYVANWPSKRIHAWNTLLAARAIENQCYVIGVNRIGTDANNLTYNGCSTIINPMGEVKFMVENDEAIFTYSIDTNTINEIRNQIPFLKDGDDYSIHL
jgi:omega-amidase